MRRGRPRKGEAASAAAHLYLVLDADLAARLARAVAAEGPGSKSEIVRRALDAALPK